MKTSLLCFVCVTVVFGTTIVDSAPSSAGAVQYLRQFGYLEVSDPRSGNLMSEEQLTDAIRVFQRFAGLRATGTIDRETLEKMAAPRCGNTDIVGTESTRKKRYALQGSKWNKKHITYHLSSTTSDLSPRDTEKAVKDAFKLWEEESGLTFSKKRAGYDIEIKFAKESHGDGDPFDGRGQTLAHAYFPNHGGDAHFDEDEIWSMSSSGGTNLKIVAAHEFGHSLGLSHSDNNQALMAPFYNPNFKALHSDDIIAIRQLYGSPEDRHKPTESTTTRRTRPTRRPIGTKKTTTTATPPVGACNGRFDAITRIANGTTYAFKGDSFWKLNDQGMEKGYPQKTTTGWGFGGKVDATLSYGDQYTDFFQGDQVRRFVRGVQLYGYPKKISDVYDGIPSDLDTAFVWSGNGRIYFVKGSQYWRFNPSTRKTDSGYPRPLSVWRGLPGSLDAALQWNDRTYFFKNGYYWRYDDEKIQVAQSLKAPYPRRSDEWWLGCSDNTLKSSPEDGETDKTDEDENGDGGNGAGSIFKTASSIQAIAPTLLLLCLTRLFS